MIGGIVHQEGRTFYFDGEAVNGPEDIPRRNGTAGTIWYTSAAVSMEKFLKLLSDGDEAFGPSPERPIGAAFYWEVNGRTSSMKVISSSVWGISSRYRILRAIPRDIPLEKPFLFRALTSVRGGRGWESALT